MLAPCKYSAMTTNNADFEPRVQINQFTSTLIKYMLSIVQFKVFCFTRGDKIINAFRQYHTHNVKCGALTSAKHTLFLYLHTNLHGDADRERLVVQCLFSFYIRFKYLSARTIQFSMYVETLITFKTTRSPIELFTQILRQIVLLYFVNAHIQYTFSVFKYPTLNGHV